MNMEKDIEQTLVVFRRWPKSERGGVLALFPEIDEGNRDEKIPESWDGIFLRELFADKGNSARYRRIERKDKMKYNNDVIIYDL